LVEAVEEERCRGSEVEGDGLLDTKKREVRKVQWTWLEERTMGGKENGR